MAFVIPCISFLSNISIPWPQSTACVYSQIVSYPLIFVWEQNQGFDGCLQRRVDKRSDLAVYFRALNGKVGGIFFFKLLIQILPVRNASPSVTTLV